MVLGAAPSRSLGAAARANHVEVRTVAATAATAGASAGRNATPRGLLVVDTAHRVTFADELAASRRAEQILQVGDPDRSDQVTTSNPAMWQGRPDAPTSAAQRYPVGRMTPCACTWRQPPHPRRLGRGDRAAVRRSVPLRPSRNGGGWPPGDRAAAPAGNRRPHLPGTLATVADPAAALLGTSLITDDASWPSGSARRRSGPTSVREQCEADVGERVAAVGNERFLKRTDVADLLNICKPDLCAGRTGDVKGIQVGGRNQVARRAFRARGALVSTVHVDTSTDRVGRAAPQPSIYDARS